VATLLTLLFLPAVYAVWYKLSKGKTTFIKGEKPINVVE
jgi:hypothetical protein